ncbi:MAG: cadherin domain-containing protein, partial [Sphingorhabdus sp.]
MSSPVAIGNGAYRSSAIVTANADANTEVAEFFYVDLTDGTGSQLMDAEGKVTIVAADENAHLMVGKSYANEADGYAVFRISLSKALAGVLSLDLSLFADNATAGTDFNNTIEISADGLNGWAPATSIDIIEGVTEYFVRVAVTADNVTNPNYNPYEIDPLTGRLIAGSGNGQAAELNVEGNERFELRATVTAGANLIANGSAPVVGIGTIVDGGSTDPLVWVDDLIIHEGQTSSVSIARSRAASTSSNVTLSTRDDRELTINISATVEGGAGDDTIYASNLGDNIFGGEGNDTLYGGRLDDWLLGGDGNDTLDAGTLDQAALGGDGNYLDGGAGNDILRGREGSDWLEGGDGADILTGGGGDDILAAGAGAGDSSKGGMGDDQYLIRLGDGEDTAEDEATGAPADAGVGDAITQRYAAIAAGTVKKNWAGGSTAIQQQKLAGGEDAIVFGYGITMGDIQLVRSTLAGGGAGNDLVIRIMQTDPDTNVEVYSGTSLTVKDWFTDPFKRIEWLKFADGNEIRIGDITSFIIGGEGNDVLVGTQGNDFVYGGAGNDQLFLLGGDDIGNGGTGNDMVWGDTGRDLVIGGLGADELIGGAGSDAISGDDGADDIYGGADRDILSGGRGDGDQIVGGGGDDTFKYSRGDGKDTVFDDFSNNWDVVWTASGQWNSAAGYSYNETTGEVTGPGGILIRKNFGTVAAPDFRWVGRFDYDSAAQTLKYFNPPVGAITTVANNGVDTIEFAPGINLQDVILRRVGNDLVMAISNDEYEVADSSRVADSVTIKDWYVAPGQIEKLAFYETGILDISSGVTNVIAGTDGADGTTTTPLAGTTLADWMSLGAGDDVAAGGAGKDIISGNSGSDLLRGEADDDVLYGGTGNDILDGGAGKDVLVGGNGIDTASYASSTSATRVRLSFAANNTANALGDEFYSIENVTGGSAADNIGGDAYENEIDGGGGADTVMGGTGSDTYIWNTTSGADIIREGAFTVEEAVTAAGTLAPGYTTTWTNTGTVSAANKFYWRLQVRDASNELVYDYALYSYGANTAMPAPTAWNVAGWLGGFAKTNGNQVTRDKFDTATSGGDSDTIEFGAGISLSDLTFIRATNGTADAAGPDLIVRYNNSATTQLTIKDHFAASGYGRVETLQFRDGLAVSLASILSATSTAALNGTANDDLLVGQTGALNDELYGLGGNDVLSGLAGVDRLYGGDGDDVLEGGAGADTLDGGANAVDGAGDTVRYVKSTAVKIDLRVATQSATVSGTTANGDAAGDILTGIENVVGSQTGNDNITGDDNANRIDGLDGNNTIYGKGGNDVIIAGTGADILYGELGDDNISSGDGNDQLWGGDGKDVLFGGVGNDQLRGEAGDDQLLGGEGDDGVLDGGIGNDEIYGDAGNDTLIGGEGNDTLGGGTGNDSLSGGLGDDTYFVQSNDGSDTIIDTDGTNIVSFDSGITYDRIWLTQAGSDLKIGVIGENTLLTVTGFFASATPGRIKSIQTTTHAIFLDHPDVLNLISAMTAASATVPTALPQAIADVQGRYWHQGGKAKPIALSTPRAISVNEDTEIAIDGNYGVIDHDTNVTGYQIKSDRSPSKGVISNFNAITGAFTYTPNANVNGVDKFSVVVTDADGNATEVPVEITIAALNDAPGAIAVRNGATLSVVESTPATILAAGTIIGEFVTTDPEGDAFTYSLVDDAGARFALSADGKLSVANPASIDFEVAASHTIRIRVTDTLGASREQDFVVAVQNGNEANSLPDSYSRGINERFWVGFSLLTVAATDIDTTGVFADQRYYFWTSGQTSSVSHDGRYAIDAFTGVVTINTALDFEAPDPARTYYVTARDNGGAAGFNEAITAVSINIVDANEANALPGSYSMTVSENVAQGTVFGTVQATDIDTAGSLNAAQRYYFSHAGTLSSTSYDGLYAIDELTGQISTNTLANFEAHSQPLWYTVTARDRQGFAGYYDATTIVTISLIDENEANSLPAAFDFSITEDASVGAWIGTIVASDIDVNWGNIPNTTSQQRYYFWDGSNASAVSDDSLYTIDVLTGEIRVNGALNFEVAQPSKTYTVIARDNAGLAGYNQVSSSVTIGVTDVNEAPISLNWNPGVASVAERDRVAAGTIRPAIALGTLSVTDPDLAGLPNATYTFTVNDNRFEIVGDTLRLKQNASFDFEAGANVVVTVTGTDTTGTPFTINRPITIAVTDEDDILEGGAGNDALTGQQGRDLIYANGGNDIVYGGEGHDVIEGGDGDDQLFGQGGVDRLLGGAGNDLLVGGDGDDYGIWHTGVADGGIWGGDGNDTIIGGVGTDLTYGEGGNDTFIVEEDGGTVWDRYDGGTGTDTLSYSHFTQGGINIDTSINPNWAGEPNARYFYGDAVTDVENVIATNFADTVIGNEGSNEIYGLGGDDDLRGGLGSDYVDGGDGNDQLQGGDGADTLTGGAGNDIIYGGAGNDTLRGGDGDDQLYAEAGDDLLDGGAGNDILNGGIDNDTYIVTRSSGADTINNYDPSGDDVDVIGFQDSMGVINDSDLWFERIGNDLKISVIGTTSSVQVANWYTVTDPASRANHKIDFIIANTSYSRTINVEALVDLMATKTRPTTLAERDVLMTDLVYKANWATHWNSNAAPGLSAISDQATNEDSAIAFSVTATDDITPNAQVQLSAQVISGTNVVSNAGIGFGAADANGVRMMTINPLANASGTARIRVTAADAGGVTSTQEFDVVVAGSADTPTVTQFAGGAGNAAQPGGIPLTLNVSFPDQDGSETQEIWITGVPAGVTLSAGTYDIGTATWKLTPAQTANLKVNTPAGWSQDLALSVTARATENGQTAVSGAVATTVVVNTAPTGISVRGLGVNPALGVDEYTPSNNPTGRVVGTAVAVDPDALDNNILPSDLSQLPLGGWGEERIITATGPLGNQVQVVETGQDGYSGDHGGGLPWVNKGPADTSKAYKFTIYFKPENNAGHNIYWGTGGNLENAWDGQANNNPYFFYGNSSSFVQDRWYRVDGYILPTGTALIGNDVYGGVFDTVTGEKVADTFTYRFGAGGSDAIARFFSYYNQSNAAYSAQWYQPSIEKLEYSYSLVDNAGGRFAINAVTGLITSTGVNLDHEAATSHNITIRVTDALGLTRDQTVSVSVSNLNEANSMATSSTFYLDENRAAGTIVGTVSASDIDVGGAFADQRYYFWNGTTAQSTSFDGRFTINATTGVITANASFNWEADPHTQHTVIARDNSGNAGYNQASTQVYIYLNNVNEQNSLPSSYSFNIEENQGIGTLLGTVAASDPDTSGAFGEQRYYFWDGSNASAFSWDGRYQIHATTGQITSNQTFNFEDPSPSRSYTVIARDNQGSGSYTQSATTVYLNITNQNETPNAPGGGSTVWSFFDESGLGSNPATPGAVVATFAMSDVDGTTPTLRLTSNPGGWFEIVGNQVRWAAGGSFNYETLRDQGYSTYDWNGDGRIDAHIANVYVDAFDGQHDSPDTLLQVFISNVNEAPSTPTGSWGNYFTETGLGGNPANAYAVAATFSQFDVDGSTPTMQFAAGGNPNNWFYISGNEVRFNPGLNFDFEWARNAGYTVYDWNGDGRLEALVATVSVQSTDGQYTTGAASTHIFIEDVNEQNSLPGSYSFSVAENLGVGTLVGTVAAADADTSAYAFGQQRYYFWNGSSATSVSSDGRYAINATTGQITTNAVLNFEGGSPSIAYTVIARDNAGNAGYNQTASTVTIGINDVNEPHSLSAASFTINESNTATGPVIPVVNAANGQAINLFGAMLSDPENRNMRWQFENGSNTSGAWRIEVADEDEVYLKMIEGRDYEEITKVYEWQDQWDYSDPYNPIYLGQAYVWNGTYNAALATQTLNVRAIDDSTGHVSTAALTLTIADFNEAPTFYSYASFNGSGGGTVITQSANEYWVTKDKNGGYIVQLSGSDPEGQSVTYSIINAQAPIERIGYYGGNDEIDASDYPYVYLDASNRINFYTPGEGNGDWEGGVKIGGTRRTSSVELNFMIRATDASGKFTESAFKVIFTRRDTNAPPIVFDLDGDGLELVPYETSTVEFDMDGDDIRDETGWVAADDGLLALDRNNNGLIDNITEISFISDVEGALTDLEGLRAYDSDQDGYLDADDADYSRFLIWRDTNQDGVSQVGELKTLAEWGIAAVNLSLTLTGQQPGQGGNVIFGTTEYEKTDGTSGTVGDVYLAYSPSNIDTLAAPIVFDYDGDNAGLIKVASSNVRFDMDGNGTPDRTGWIEAGDAFLALDRNGNGEIDNIREISFVEDKEGATTDLEGLRGFDSNGDGVLSADDDRFAEFKLWFDSNSNGVTDAGELQSLAEAGITSMDLIGTPADPADVNVRPNIIYNRTSFTRADGSNGTAFDAGIAFERPGANGSTEVAYAGWSGELNMTADAATTPPLPSIRMETRGYDRKAKRYLLDIRDGGIYVTDPKAKGAVDPRAGLVGGAAILSFSNMHIGMLSPVILDLDGDGLDIRSRKKSKAMFDMDGDGRADDTGWVGKGDGMLVIDRNRDGRITRASELSFLTEKPDAKSDLEALAVLDSNKDGKLDARDTRFGELMVCIDANENGVSDEGELQTLAELGITEISLASRANAQKVKVGQNAVIATTTFKRTDGSIGTAGDVALAFDPSSKRPGLADNQLAAM